MAFVGLAVFLLLRVHPENWPLGPDKFSESFSLEDVAQQHRLFVVMILVFAASEIGVHTERLTSGKAALVVPLVYAVSIALLLTHTHVLSNLKVAVLAEKSHVPLALLAVMVQVAGTEVPEIMERGAGASLARVLRVFWGCAAALP